MGEGDETSRNSPLLTPLSPPEDTPPMRRSTSLLRFLRDVSFVGGYLHIVAKVASAPGGGEARERL